MPGTKYLGRLSPEVIVGEQPHFLLPGRRAVVQPILRAQPRKGVPHQLSCPHHIQLVHTDVTECGIFQCLGNYPEGVEGSLPENHHGFVDRYSSTDNQHFPSAANMRSAVVVLIVFRLKS